METADKGCVREVVRLQQRLSEGQSNQPEDTMTLVPDVKLRSHRDQEERPHHTPLKRDYKRKGQRNWRRASCRQSPECDGDAALESRVELCQLSRGGAGLQPATDWDQLQRQPSDLLPSVWKPAAEPRPPLNS
ncbi:unnamed protein product [Pleuronectes platessa]|uniref:Uncharacterized protein n=1 Tax=Pleuronectes platessa TaxID=8262 RepID=A0A9N7TLK4_PLEPL|nr:unnamed protein product [Pleuronectes platessa]